MPRPNNNEEFDPQLEILEGIYPGDWPEGRAHENGDYFCKCAICGATFRGHKRRPVCKICAGPPVAIADTID